MNRLGYFFSLDALIALLLVVALILFIDPVPQTLVQDVSFQEDTLKVLSELKVYETNNSYVKGLIASGKIKNLNNSILEQIGEFYALEDPEAVNLSLEFLQSLEHENVGIWINNDFIASRNTTPYNTSRQIWTSRQIISGIQKGSNVTGYSSRAFLTKSALMKYFYFGGYVGDGNITAIINYNGTIKAASIEVAINRNFSLYINNLFVGNFTPGNTSFEPVTIDLSGHLGKFQSGDNKIEFLGAQLYIAGGYLVIDYESEVNYQAPVKYPFPGIDGVINLYDSFYIPGTLNDMEIFLHFNVSNNSLFLTVGNITVYNTSSANGETSVTLTNAQLDPLLDYHDLSNKTTPLRFGLENVTLLSQVGDADVVLITDLSGSMNFSLVNDTAGIAQNCSDPGLYNSTTKRISLAKCLDKSVVDTILNATGNRLALVGFYADGSPPYRGRIYESNFSTNKTQLYQNIDGYNISGGTCICCGINDAWALFNESNSGSRKKFVIVMSDGIPTHTCQAASGCAGTRTGRPSDEGLWLGFGAGCYGGSDDCEVNDCQCASDNANWSSCRVYDTYNATVYSIGFGPVATCTMANRTLRNVAQCGRGKYYSSDNATLLKEIYSNISNEIVGLSYTEQIVFTSGGFARSRLYTDSYIKFNYTQKSVPYGIALSYRTENFGNNISQGSFDISLNSTPVEVNALSYSGARWTDNVTLLNTSWRFRLGDYGSDYGKIGDPYVVNIPEQYVALGNNTVVVKTGTSPSNPFGGSRFNKVAYTIVKSFLTYSPILLTATGCSWNVTFEDGSQEIIDVPDTYAGGQLCYFAPGNVSYNANDAIDVAIYNLFNLLDADNDDRIDIKLSQQGLGVSSVEVEGIPFTWSSEVQIRAWR